MKRIGQVLVMLVAFGFFLVADVSSSQSRPREGYDGEGKRGGGHRPWLCCDRCGGCTKSIPPRCQCQDLLSSCHPLCKNCVRYPLSVDPPRYQCMDRIPNYCKRACTPKSLVFA